MQGNRSLQRVSIALLGRRAWGPFLFVVSGARTHGRLLDRERPSWPRLLVNMKEESP